MPNPLSTLPLVLSFYIFLASLTHATGVLKWISLDHELSSCEATCTPALSAGNDSHVALRDSSGDGGSTGYSVSQGTSGRGFPATMTPQCTMYHHYPTAYYGQQDSRQTQGTYNPSNAAVTVYRQPELQGYSAGSMPAIGGMTAQTTHVGMQEKCPDAAGLDEAYASYQSALRVIFQNVRDGGLETASESLLGVSDWLLSHVVELGMSLAKFLPAEWNMTDRFTLGSRPCI